MNKKYVPQVLSTNSSTIMLFKCTLRKYADEFVRGEVYFGFPKNWIDIEKKGKRGQGDILEGTFAAVIPLVNPSLYTRMKSDKDSSFFSYGGYTFFRRNAVLNIPCICFYGLNNSEFSRTKMENGQVKYSAVIPKEYFQDFSDCKNKKEYDKLDDKEKAVVVLITDVHEFFSRIKKALKNIGVSEDDIIIEPVNYINKFTEGVFLGNAYCELLLKDIRFKLQSEIRIIVNSIALKKELIRHNNHFDVGSLEDITEIYDYYFDDLHIERFGKKSLMLSLPEPKEYDIETFSFIELYILLCNIVVFKTVRLVGETKDQSIDLNTQLKLIIDLFKNKFNVIVSLEQNKISLYNVSTEYQKQLDEHHINDDLICKTESILMEKLNQDGPVEVINFCNGLLNDKIVGKVSYHYLGLAYKMLGDNEKAIHYFSCSFELDYKPIESLNDISSILFFNEQYEDAIRVYKRIQDLKGYEDRIWANIGICYIHLSRYTDAIEAFDKAIELNSQDPYLYYNQGVSYFLNGETELAKALMQKAMEIDPDNKYYIQEYNKAFG